MRRALRIANGGRSATAGGALLLGALALSSCPSLRTPALLQELNKPASPAGSGIARLEPSTRIARLAKGHMGDAYVYPIRVAAWLIAMGQSPNSLIDLVRCLENPPSFDPEACFGTFTDAVSKGVWGLPPAPATLEGLKDRGSEQAGAELDVERFVANARALAWSLASLEKLNGRGMLSEPDLAKGITAGAERAAQYIAGRSWRRNASRPSTAIVLSGGAANGAFTAGVVWRLMETIDSCRNAPSGGCPGAKIDLVAGTSTGALIGLLIDLYSTPGKQAAARNLLVNSYTCSVDSDLYCVNDEWDWALIEDLKGLVRFDGIRRKIRTQVPWEVARNDTEMVAVSVDFESGDINAHSDQDPEDRGGSAAWVDGVLASIVEPVFAEPVPALARDGAREPGTYLDGGVRSGLPLLEAVRRGAERVLVLSTSRLEPDRTAAPRNAIQILLRTLDLLSGQPLIGELQLGELAALERRMLEYNVCVDRLRPLSAHSKSDVTEFCERRAGFHSPPQGVQGAALGWMGPAQMRQVASSWRTAWIFRPEQEVETAVGYSFDPKVMRKLFELGAATFQQRCPEVLDLLMIGGEIARETCRVPPDEVVRRAQGIYRPLDVCSARQSAVRTCGAREAWER